MGQLRLDSDPRASSHFWASEAVAKGARHITRIDWAMLLGALYVLRAGPGPWSLDRRLFGRRDR